MKLVCILDSLPIDGVETELGCELLREEVINRIRPQVHIFGHIHSQHGALKYNRLSFVNASLLNENYEVVYKPLIIELGD